MGCYGRPSKPEWDVSSAIAVAPPLVAALFQLVAALLYVVAALLWIMPAPL